MDSNSIFDDMSFFKNGATLGLYFLFYFLLKINKNKWQLHLLKKKKSVFYNKNKSHHQVGMHMKNAGSQLYSLGLKYNTIN